MSGGGRSGGGSGGGGSGGGGGHRGGSGGGGSGGEPSEPDDLPHHKSLFERFDIDPRQGPRAITERLRELAEDAGEAERAEIRAAWEELTLHPARRLRAAFAAHPESRPPLGSPPPLPRELAVTDRPLTLSDLAVQPSVARAFASLGLQKAPPPGSPRSLASLASPSSLASLSSLAAIATPPPLEDDPILKKVP